MHLPLREFVSPVYSIFCKASGYAFMSAVAMTFAPVHTSFRSAHHRTSPEASDEYCRLLSHILSVELLAPAGPSSR